jgi:signal transduction histidine kinase
MTGGETARSGGWHRGRNWLPSATAQALAMAAVLLARAGTNGTPLRADAVRFAVPLVVVAGVVYLQVRHLPGDWAAEERSVVAAATLVGLSATTALAVWEVYSMGFSTTGVPGVGRQVLCAAAYGLGAGALGGRLYATQRHTARQLRTERERLDAFAGMLSHDLRTPLTVAKSRVDLAREDPGGDHLDDADAALERMEGLVEEVLTLARGGDGDVDAMPVDVGELARSAWADLPVGDATLRLADPPVVDADRRKLRRLLVNLLENALDHADPDEVTVGALADGTGFYVADDGPGVPGDDREAVFTRGYTTADGGHGLGLAIVAELADAHGWSVACVESDAGGARFELRT